MAMQLLGLGKFPGPLHQPAEKALPIFPQPLGMPLNAHDGLSVLALHGLYRTIHRLGSYPETTSWVTHRLMVEAVDKDVLSLVKVTQNRTIHKLDCMGRLRAVRVLVMLDTHLDILRHFPTQGNGQGLYAPTDAQHGYLPLESQASHDQLRLVALLINMV